MIDYLFEEMKNSYLDWAHSLLSLHWFLHKSQFQYFRLKYELKMSVLQKLAESPNLSRNKFGLQNWVSLLSKTQNVRLWLLKNLHHNRDQFTLVLSLLWAWEGCGFLHLYVLLGRYNNLAVWSLNINKISERHFASVLNIWKLTFCA